MMVGVTTAGGRFGPFHHRRIGKPSAPCRGVSRGTMLISGRRYIYIVT